MPKNDKEIIEFGLVRPQWADEQFGQWLIAHCALEDAHPVIMPMQLCINGAVWIKEQFRNQTCNAIEPDENSAREMFSSIVAIHVSSGIPQREIFQQIFEGYLRNLPQKA